MPQRINPSAKYLVGEMTFHDCELKTCYTEFRFVRPFSINRPAVKALGIIQDSILIPNSYWPYR
jgi:hypothetical protein